MGRMMMAVLMGVACSAALAEEKKIPEAKAEVGGMRLRTMAPMNYVYVETETTFDKLGDAIAEAIVQMVKSAEEGKYKMTSLFVLSYPGGTAHVTPQKPFKVQIGVKVEGEVTPTGNVKLRKTEDFRAATIIYTGPPAGIGECYQKLMPAIRDMGLELSGEDREFTLYWEGFESPNNIILVQVGVKDKK